VNSHLREFLQGREADVKNLVDTFLLEAKSKELATDQLLNAVFLTIGLREGVEKTIQPKEIDELRTMLLEKLA
jgi:hypothetical protein